eukprot:2710862-Rhodomonas_salina.1
MQEPQASVNVTTPLRVDWVLRHRDARSIVLVDHSRMITLQVTQIPEQVAKVDNLLPTHAGSDKLSVSRTERSARLTLGVPAHRAVVHRDHIARHRTTSVWISSLVAVHPAIKTIDVLV